MFPRSKEKVREFFKVTEGMTCFFSCEERFITSYGEIFSFYKESFHYAIMGEVLQYFC